MTAADTRTQLLVYNACYAADVAKICMMHQDLLAALQMPQLGQ